MQAYSLFRVVLSSTQFWDGVYPNLSPTAIDDTIELLNIELDCRHLYIDMTLTLIVATN